ncbi:MAG: transcription-repair coupling factor [Hyphomicrobiales bacterium]|nr:transcription-repair coupling factor [Hyphomicrobiales bacterium]
MNAPAEIKRKAAPADAAAAAIRLFRAAKGGVAAAGAPEGYDAFLVHQLASAEPGSSPPRFRPVLHIARDDQRMEAMRQALQFYAPDADVIAFPAWDCVPYDRVSPDAEITSRRITALARLARLKEISKPLIVLTTVNAAIQRVLPRDYMAKTAVRISTGAGVGMTAIGERLEAAGFNRTGTVMEPGEYAMRGGILDMFPPGQARPVRLDFFGDTLESIRVFDPVTQRTQGAKDQVILLPVSEVRYSAAVIKQFRQRYVELFGAVTTDDPLYEAVSAGRRVAGVEHWLPLFYDRLDTLFDYLPDAYVTFDHLAADARMRRMETIEDHYEARVKGLEHSSFGAGVYKPVPPKHMFLDADGWDAALKDRDARFFSPFDQPEGGGPAINFGGKQGRGFGVERAEQSDMLFPAVIQHIGKLRGEGKRVLVAAFTPGGRERLGSLLTAHGLPHAMAADSYAAALKLPRGSTGVAVLPLENGFETTDFAVIAEQDILGDRLVRRRKPKKASDVLQEASSLAPGDLVVHADHGIGRFTGLQTVTAAGAPHDCLELEYAGGSKLFLPVENIELLSRYGADEGAALDKLGGGAWQARKAKLKKRIRDIAESLIAVAAARQVREGVVMSPQGGAYDEFVARFPFEETDDQLSSIEAVMEDLAKGRPMDRLICGDVGFGKTEVALRAAFVAVLEGFQVAVVVPTTLLARQHYKTFAERFQGFPVKVARASRLVPAKEMAETREGLKSGQIDIVVGTHAVLSKTIEFNRLGLLIIDEEQHFGVAHKERLKQMREDVHVLTLTATPIPRTLQLALTGVRELSVIATPPVDRLAVRTFITPFDPVTLREALLRERYRGGQSFYVVPRISDLDEVAAFLREVTPELKFQIGHGQMSPTQLEDVMSAFYDKQFDVLLSTTIVESGLDIPNANTLIVHRADMFGLAQLYQLRGRVGRSKTRAYALFTTPPNAKLTPAAEKRLKVLHSLDSLGAGFQLASYDLDIRGAGNLLGDEQSGHIREVGYELYQQMLEEAVAHMRDGAPAAEAEEQWSPSIQLGAAVLIPEAYVPDLQVRLGLYRRLSGFKDPADIEAFAAELADRFGAPPDEVRHLLGVVHIKMQCRAANISAVDAGPKGGVVAFRNNQFPNPPGLLKFINEHRATVKLQPDHKLLIKADWADAGDRIKDVRALVAQLAAIAGGGKAGAGR